VVAATAAVAATTIPAAEARRAAAGLREGLRRREQDEDDRRGGDLHEAGHRPIVAGIGAAYGRMRKVVTRCAAGPPTRRAAARPRRTGSGLDDELADLRA
jgi:hypothetical protein